MQQALPAGHQDVPRRDIVIEVSARALEKMRKEARSRSATRPDAKEWTLYCDEGSYLGGDDSAPPPLHYFSVGLAF